MAKVQFLALALFGLSVGAARAEEKAPIAKGAGEISYYKTIRPIIQQNCQGCHQPARSQGGYVMTSHALLMKPGERGGAAVSPGHPETSALVKEITGQTGKPPKMPKGKQPLLDRDVALIVKWIGQGAKDDTPAAAREVVDMQHPPTYALPPVITSVAYSPDSSLLAVSGYHEVLIHKADGSGLVARLVGLSERIQALAFSPDGKSLAVSGGDPGRFGEVQIWNVAARKLRLSLPVTYDTIYGVSWSPDGQKLAFGCSDNTLRAIEADTGKQVLFQGAHSDWVLDTVFSTTASHLVSVSRDRSMKLTEVATQRFVDNITSITPGALKGGLMTVDRHPKRDELLIGGSDGVPKIYQMYRNKKRVIGDDFNLLRTFDGMPGRIFSAKFSADGKFIVAGSSLNGSGDARVYRCGPEEPDARLIKLAALPSILTRGLAAALVLPDARGLGQTVSRLEGQRGAVYCVAYRPDGKQVASAGFDGVVRLHDPRTGKLIKEFVPMPVTANVARAQGR